MYTRDPKIIIAVTESRRRSQSQSQKQPNDRLQGLVTTLYILRSAIGPETTSAPPPCRSLTEVFVGAARQTRLLARSRSGPGASWGPRS